MIIDLKKSKQQVNKYWFSENDATSVTLQIEFRFQQMEKVQISIQDTVFDADKQLISSINWWSQLRVRSEVDDLKGWKWTVVRKWMVHPKVDGLDSRDYWANLNGHLS